MASAQVDATQVEEFTKPSEEPPVGSPNVEESAKAPAPENIKSPYHEEDDDDDDDEEKEVILPDELEKHEDSVDEDDLKAQSPQILEDKDDEDEDEEVEDEAPLSKSAGRASAFSEEEGDDDDEV